MRIVKIAAILLAYLVVADIIGVIVCTLFDIAPLRHKSGLLAYAVWLVLGVFAGLLAYNTAGGLTAPKSETADEDWTTRPDALRVGSLVLWASAAILIALAGFFYWLYWSRGVAGEYFVPDSASHTLLFLVSVIGGMLIGRLALMPAPAGPAAIK
jgi:hypothetical protein